MERPLPTKQLLIELCGGNQTLISSVHHGLYETPLGPFYPHLDLEELIAFAASSWKSREKGESLIEETTYNLFSNTAYEIFSNIKIIGQRWVNKYKNISPELQTKYKRLNSFQGERLEERLSRVDPKNVDNLKTALLEGVNEYIFECQYEKRKRSRSRGNYKLEIMHFQPVYPKKGVIIPNFAAEIRRIIAKFPREYQPL